MALFEYTGLDWRFVFTAVTVLIFLATEVYSLFISQGKGYFWISLAVTAMIIAALWINNAAGRVILLDAAALLLVAWVWHQDQHAGKLFLAAVVVGSIFVAVGMGLGGYFGGQAIQPQGMQARIIIALILIGFALKLAVVPFSFWLAPVSERSSPMTSVLVISLLDMAEFGELAFLRVEAPWIFSAAQWGWVALALLSMVGGALLAMAQTNLRRMLAYSTIDDIGYLVFGLAIGSAGGVLGALIGAISHSLCKFLLFSAVGMAEDDLKHPFTFADRGVAGRQPVAGAAFIAGALGMIGVPPLVGFLGKWRLYYGGLEAGGVVLSMAMAVATALALFYYVRAIHRVWLGQAVETTKPACKRFTWIEIIMIGLISLLIIAGLFPAILPGLGGR
jgi:multicomponent Na+:H+ antiporter subunit D